MSQSKHSAFHEVTIRNIQFVNHKLEEVGEQMQHFFMPENSCPLHHNEEWVYYITHYSTVQLTYFCINITQLLLINSYPPLQVL